MEANGIACHLGAKTSGARFNAHLPRRRSDLIGKTSGAARSVPAHLRLGTIGIEKKNGKILRTRRPDQDQAIGPDPRSTGAHSLYKR